MNSRDSMLESVFDVLREGVICVQEDGEILLANQRARALLGLGESWGPGHSAGSVYPGDIVLLVNSSLGADDGGLTPRDLSLIGVSPDSKINVRGCSGSDRCVQRTRWFRYLFK